MREVLELAGEASRSHLRLADPNVAGRLLAGRSLRQCIQLPQVVLDLARRFAVEGLLAQLWTNQGMVIGQRPKIGAQQVQIRADRGTGRLVRTQALGVGWAQQQKTAPQRADGQPDSVSHDQAPWNCKLQIANCKLKIED